MELTINQQAFFALVRAGLFSVQGEGFLDEPSGRAERVVHDFSNVDWGGVYSLAEEQSVVGLIADGIDRFKLQDSGFKCPQEWALQFIGQTLQIEQRNKAMNHFIAKLVSELRSNDIYTLLVKGQGVAQCYERPLWRACGDVDLYLSSKNYEKAKAFLVPLAHSVEQEDKKRLHLGMTIEDFVVELHGTMHTGVSRKMNRLSDEVHQDIFYSGNVRSWNNDGVQVFLPSPNNDVIIIFNHFINHFYGEGIGLRQICDWCRLLFCYREKLDLRLLESRIRRAGLMTEWKAFAAFAVEYLGMPVEAMPLYPAGSKSQVSSFMRKAEKICRLIIETGNFGHNKDESYRREHSKMVGNFITAWKRFNEFARIATIFPGNAPKFYVTYLFNRIRAVV